jgi:hypothetical protein
MNVAECYRRPFEVDIQDGRNVTSGASEIEGRFKLVSERASIATEILVYADDTVMIDNGEVEAYARQKRVGIDVRAVPQSSKTRTKKAVLVYIGEWNFLARLP